jgi:hypothetical protein
MHWSWQPHQFVAADDGHDAERLDTIVLGIERRVRAIVAEDNVGVHLGVQIGDANIVVDDGIFEAGLGLSVATASASSVFASTTLLAVAIDVHVDELLPVAVQVDDVGIIIFTVPERLLCRWFSRLLLCGLGMPRVRLPYLCCHRPCCGNHLAVRSDNDSVP